MLRLAAVLSTWVVAVPAFGANRAEAPHVSVSLVADGAHARPGGEIELGLRFELEPDWHVYWTNPGDSGERPKVAWTLPAGFEAGPLLFPVPERIVTNGIINYVYDREVLLVARVRVPAPAPELAKLVAKVSWLVCKEDCIPGKAELDLTLPVSREPARASEHAPLFAATRAHWPIEVPARAAERGDSYELVIAAPPARGGAVRYAFYPRDPLVLDEARPPQVTERTGELVVTLARATGGARPQTLGGLLVRTTEDARDGLAVDAAFSSAPALAAVASGAAPLSLALALLFAFLGGAILNLMPCVFPVLSLKILGFVEHAHAQPRLVRRHGWAYAGGVLASFWILGGLLMALRAGSERLGWGFQLQSPIVVAGLVGLMVALALNLLGTFEIGLALTRLGATGGGGTLSGSFATGVLATVVATPCTAPFMGAALGFALTQPVSVALAIFTALAIGMAAPYVILSHAPGMLARLPRPGAWMETLKQVLAFPLFGTALWLLVVFHALAGPTATFELLGALLLFGFGAWLYGQWQRSRRRPKVVLALALVVPSLAVTAGIVAARGGAPAGGVAETGGAPSFWEPWSPERVAALRREGRPVFVNFTAAWCLSCQVNERVAFRDEDVRNAFAARRVLALKADWTNRDDVIAATLAEHGRAGVPLYLYYPPRVGAEPVVLPSVLTPAMVLETIANTAISANEGEVTP